MNVLQQIANEAAASPEKIAYESEGIKLSYGELWQQSNHVAEVIRQMALPKESPIVVYGHMSPQQIIGFLGATKAGHPYIPLDTSLPIERILYIIEASKASLVIEIESQQEVLATSTRKTTVDELLQTSSELENAPETWVKGDQVFYIIYTSGSTGNPKGVQISEGNLASFVSWIEEACMLSNGVYLNQAPYSFDLSVMDLYPALTKGRTVHAITKTQIENAASLFEELEKSSISVWTSTPSFVKICLMNPQWNEEQMPFIQTFLFCGEVLPINVATALQKRFPKAKIFNLYGPTETTVAVSAIEVTEELLNKFEALPIAKANSSLLKIVDEQLVQMPEGEKGEIMISGPSVSTKGYLFAAEQSAKVFKQCNEERIYQAGDVGYVQDGYVFYAGRSDFQIKLHGYRMEIEEIEKQIEALSEVSSCVIVPVKKEGEIVSLTACLALKEELEDKPFKMTKNLKMKLSNVLPNYMVPKKFVYMDALPLTVNGKLDRKRMAVELAL